jgi:hypothetical protein
MGIVLFLVRVLFSFAAMHLSSYRRRWQHVEVHCNIIERQQTYGTDDVVPVMIEKLSFILADTVAKCEAYQNAIFDEPAEVEE